MVVAGAVVSAPAVFRSARKRSRISAAKDCAHGRRTGGMPCGGGNVRGPGPSPNSCVGLQPFPSGCGRRVPVTPRWREREQQAGCAPISAVAQGNAAPGRRWSWPAVWSAPLASVDVGRGLSVSQPPPAGAGTPSTRFCVTADNRRSPCDGQLPNTKR